MAFWLNFVKSAEFRVFSSELFFIFRTHIVFQNSTFNHLGKFMKYPNFLQKFNLKTILIGNGFFLESNLTSRQQTRKGFLIAMGFDLNCFIQKDFCFYLVFNNN